MIDADTHERFWEAGALTGFLSFQPGVEYSAAMIDMFAENAFLCYIGGKAPDLNEEDPAFWPCFEAFTTPFKLAYQG